MSMAKDPPMDTTPVITPARPRSPPHEPHLRLNHSKKPYLYPLVTTTEYSSPSSPSPLTPPLTPAYTLQPLQALRYHNLHPRSNCSPAPISSLYHFNPTPSSSSQSGTESIFPVSDLSPPLTYLSTPRSVNESVSESTDFGAHSHYSISTDDSEDVVFAGAEQQLSPVDGNLDAIQAPSRFLFVGGVPNAATTALLKQEFAPCGELKGIYVGFQYEHGVVVLAFFDVRTATRAHELIVRSRVDDDGSESATFFAGRKLASRFVSFSELYKAS
ncbi:hypothetical protein BS47DRAFT_105393 [Hydnum rufescens UP504]|uniref:RRM domain-containing protein n=1 Tax=Hydnum rufescens UP504 TaxID=1448309 RepID=A0A9P6DT00_9AGAM|nr:hypothetical protein BS47DRAFT_105393 [Hydnum rufescens UP504]